MDNVISVDKDCYEFLRYILYGAEKGPFPAVSKCSYRDLCRTLRFNGKSGRGWRKYIDTLLEKRITALVQTGVSSQEEYDTWHEELSDEMIKYYTSEGITFTYGHAQKWINMTMKHLYFYGGMDLTSIFDYLHIPVDSYVFSAAEKQFGISPPCDYWSKITDHGLYLNYQKQLREKISALNTAPLRWEFSAWLNKAKEDKSNLLNV